MDKKPKFRLSLALALGIAIVFGFISGIVGELWINQFISPEIQFKNYSDLTKRLDELTAQKQKELKDLLGEQDFSINKVVEKIQPLVVNFYPSKTATADLSSVYLDNEILGSGFILTSDGWLVTSKQVITDPKVEYSVEIDQQVYPVQKIIADTITDVVFVKVQTNNLPVIDFGSKNSLNYSQSVLVATPKSGVVRSTIQDLFYADLEKTADLIHSSESYYRYLLLNDDFIATDLGAPVFTLDGKVIGILISKDGKVLPIDYFSQVIKQAVQEDQVVRSMLGVNFLDLELAPNYASEIQKGALLLGDASRQAVLGNSPAKAAGLQAGDIITKVDNEEVNKYHSLSQIIQDFKPGSEVTLLIIRDGIEDAIKVTLDSL